MDNRQRFSFYEAILEKKRRERIEMQLLLAEAINYAYIGSQSPKKKGQMPKGAMAYREWIKKKQKILNPSRKQATVWDVLVRKKTKGKRSFRIN